MGDKRIEKVYRLRLKASPQKVFALLTTDQGRGAFWAERTEQHDDEIVFYFPNGEELLSRVLESRPFTRFTLTYFNDSIVTIDLREHAAGTDLRLRESFLFASDLCENRAG